MAPRRIARLPFHLDTERDRDGPSCPNLHLIARARKPFLNPEQRTRPCGTYARKTDAPQESPPITSSGPRTAVGKNGRIPGDQQLGHPPARRRSPGQVDLHEEIESIGPCGRLRNPQRGRDEREVNVLPRDDYGLPGVPGMAHDVGGRSRFLPHWPRGIDCNARVASQQPGDQGRHCF